MIEMARMFSVVKTRKTHGVVDEYLSIKKMKQIMKRKRVYQKQ